MNNFKVPPPFVRCLGCSGYGYRTWLDPVHVIDADMPIPKGNIQCPICKTSPLPGWLPQFYTPEQYRDWVRRENDLPDYELPKTSPCWARFDGEEWDLLEYASVFKTEIAIVATIAGIPPEDYRP